MATNIFTMELSDDLRAELAKLKVCGVICNCGPEGEPLACGYAPSHKGNHSWASIPSFCYGQHEYKRQRQGGAPDDASSLEIVEYCENCGSEKRDDH